MSVHVRGAAGALVLAAALLAVPAAGTAAAASANSATSADSPSGFRIEDPQITESSGLAASRAHKNVYWTHNDSDDGPYVYAVDGRTGRTVATVTLQGIDPRDVEAVSVGPDGDVYVGDIGDNLDGTWPEVYLYRFPEPERLADTTVTPARYTVRYADGPRDAESLMVHPRTGRVYIASKSDEKKGGLYAGPQELSASGVNTFTRVARIDTWATDGAFSPDGTRLVLRGYFSGDMYRWRDGKPVGPLDTPVSVPMQRQGESVAFTPDGRTLMCGTEGEGSSVEPVQLDGELLPESAARADRDDEKGGGSSGDGASGADEDRNVVVGGVTFVVAVGLWMGARRLFRRRD